MTTTKNTIFLKRLLEGKTGNSLVIETSVHEMFSNEVPLQNKNLFFPNKWKRYAFFLFKAFASSMTVFFI